RGDRSGRTRSVWFDECISRSRCLPPLWAVAAVMRHSILKVPALLPFQALPQTTIQPRCAADKKDVATLNALFASATQGPTQGRSDDPAAELAGAADFAGEPSHTPLKETLEPRGRA